MCSAPGTVRGRFSYARKGSTQARTGAQEPCSNCFATTANPEVTKNAVECAIAEDENERGSFATRHYAQPRCTMSPNRLRKLHIRPRFLPFPDSCAAGPEPPARIGAWCGLRRAPSRQPARRLRAAAFPPYITPPCLKGIAVYLRSARKADRHRMTSLSPSRNEEA